MSSSVARPADSPSGPSTPPGPMAGWARSGDTSGMRARLTSSRFVGRVGELAELELALREATAGTPAVVLLGGESGVGKTRLISELQRRLGEADEPALVLRGESVEQRDGELPYAPLLRALRLVVRERHPTFERLSPVSRSDLATLLPALASRGPSAERDGATW